MERATIAFGSYLRSLRERRGLSLPQVAGLTSASVRPLDKGTLSRIERGQQQPAVSALIPICHIYAVSAEVLVEKLELDTELARSGAPATDGLGLADLLARGRAALVRHGRKWDAYGYFREAASRGADATPRERFAASLNVATAIRSLGKNRLALHELRELERRRSMGDADRSIVIDRISHCHRCLGEVEVARRFAEEAVDLARASGDRRLLAFTRYSRACLACDRGDVATGIPELAAAFRAYREAGAADGAIPWSETFEVDALLRLSEAYMDSGAREKSGRAVLAARHLATERGLPAKLAYCDLSLGQLDHESGRTDDATRRWRQTAAVAAKLRNQRLAFSAEFFLYRSVLDAGHTALARASERRLERLAPWVPAHLPLLARFRESIPASGAPTRRRLGRGALVRTGTIRREAT